MHACMHVNEFSDELQRPVQGRHRSIHQAVGLVTLPPLPAFAHPSDRSEAECVKMGGALPLVN